jgi:hypothetical protein
MPSFGVIVADMRGVVCVEAHWCVEVDVGRVYCVGQIM